MSVNADGMTWMCDTGNHEKCTEVKDCECACHHQVFVKEYDDSVLRDAASQFEAAARRLKKAITLRGPARNRMIGEARALMHGAEARIK